MEQPLTLPDLTATKTRSRLEEEGGPRRAQSRMCKAPDLGYQHSGPSVSNGGLGVHLRGGGWGALDRVPDTKRPHSSLVIQSETHVELRALVKDQVETKWPAS